MSFVDRATVHVTAGAGGSGASSFRREKYVPKGGPDGGDGGRGGSVYVRADPQLSTLLDYKYRAHWNADRGQHGQGAKKTGKSGDDLILPIPPGTVIRDVDSGETIGEVLESGDQLLVARGGRGGRGNAQFATSTHRSPREWEPGGEGEERNIELVLKLIADVGLVGEPNAGKSTLLSVVSAATPKIADYPFTTLVPQLGVAMLAGSRALVVADIPGLIEGAHDGKGLGDRFLQHIERTRVLVFLIPLDAVDPQAVYNLLRAEIRSFHEELADRPHVVVLSKLDLWPADLDVPRIHTEGVAEVMTVSSVAQRGIKELLERLWMLARAEGGTLDRVEVPLPSELT